MKVRWQQQRPKIVQITTVPFTLIFLQGQPRFMTQAGFEWTAVSSPGDQLDEFGRTERVAVHAVPMTRRITMAQDFVALVRLWRYLRRTRPHIVHAHTPKAGLLGMIAAALARVPVRIYQLHGLPMATATGLRRRLLTWSEKLACRLAHEVLAVSPSLQQLTVSSGLCAAGRVRVLGQGTANGVDARGRFDPRYHAAHRAQIQAASGIPPEATVVGFVGRLVPDKGVVELLQAWQSLRDEFPELHLLMVGPEESESPLPDWVRQRLLQDARIHSVGFHRDPAPLYAAMDVLLLPSHREGFGMAAMEAAAMALPVVATCVTGCVDAVVDGVTGTLVPPHNADALAAAVRTYVRDPLLRRRHGQAGRMRVVQHFQPVTVWNALRSEYIRLLRQHGWHRFREPQEQRRIAA